MTFNKAALLQATAACVRSPVIWPLVRPFYRRNANIVYYHAVWPTGSRPLSLFYGIDLDTFAGHMKLLRRHFQPVHLEEILRPESTDGASNEPLMAVTFDDGCDLARSGALDVLDNLDIPATTFVVLECVGNNHLMWQHKFTAIRGMRGDDLFVREFNRLAEKVEPGSSIRFPKEQTLRTRRWPMERKDEYADVVWQACNMPPVDEFLAEHRPSMDWANLADWCRRGHRVGLHTRTHPFCSMLTGAGIEAEIVTPAQELRSRMGLSTVPFAYPFGDRLPWQQEAEVAMRGGLSCLLGIRGFSLRGTPAWHMDRIGVEHGFDDAVFARPLLQAARTRRWARHSTGVNLFLAT